MRRVLNAAAARRIIILAAAQGTVGEHTERTLQAEICESSDDHLLQRSHVPVEIGLIISGKGAGVRADMSFSSYSASLQCTDRPT